MKILSELTNSAYRQFTQACGSVDLIDPTYIPIVLPGGIGDAICCLDSILELKKQYDVIIHSKHYEIIKYFEPSITVLSERLPKYTWFLELDNVGTFKFNEGFSGFQVLSHKDLYLRQMMRFVDDPIIRKIVNNRINKYFMISMHAKSRRGGLTKREYAMYSLGFNGFEPRPFIKSDNSDTFITIHDGFDAQIPVAGRSTKTWKWLHWYNFVRQFKLKYPNIKVIQLGSKTSREIDGVDICLVNKCNLITSLDYLSQSRLHIDGDSGLVHGAARLGIPSVVMWGPTSDSFYGYNQNINLRNTSTCNGTCYGLKPDWNSKCPIGFTAPLCMDDITVDEVMEAVDKMFEIERTEAPPIQSLITEQG